MMGSNMMQIFKTYLSQLGSMGILDVAQNEEYTEAFYYIMNAIPSEPIPELAPQNEDDDYMDRCGM